MKYGVRTPSVKKMTSSRTTGMINRKVKSSFYPLYGKNGMGILKNCKKSIYNKVYNKTTMSIKDINTNIYNNKEEIEEYNRFIKRRIIHLLLGILSIIFSLYLIYLDFSLVIFGSIFFAYGILSCIENI